MAPRLDGWLNFFTKLGVEGYDARASTTYGPGRTLTQLELEDLFSQNDLARRMVAKPAGDMVREWWQLSDPELNDRVQAQLKARSIKARKNIKQALIWARLYGGAIIILGIDDGRNPAQEIEPGRKQTIRWLNVLHRHQVEIQGYQGDPMAGDFGEVTLYKIRPGYPHRAGFTLPPAVHSSRVLRFDGAVTTPQRKAANGGWCDSVLQAAYDTVRDFGSTWDGVTALMSRLSETVMAIQGLAQKIAQNGEDEIVRRIQIANLARSILGTILIDAENESVTEKPAATSGAADILDRLERRVSAAADMPVSILFGRSAAGMNATGELDVQTYYDGISDKQEDELRDPLEQLVRLLVGGSWQLQFHPLWQPSEKDQVEARNKQAQSDELYIRNQVLHPEEVRQSRFGGEEYSIETSLEPEFDHLAQEAAEAEAEAQAEAQAAAAAAAAGGGLPPGGGTGDA